MPSVHRSAFLVHRSTHEWLAAAVAEARGRVLLLGAAGGAGVFGAEVGAAAGAVGRVRADDGAAGAAAPGHRRDVAARLARDVPLDDLPGVLGQLVLPVGPERRQREQ